MFPGGSFVKRYFPQISRIHVFLRESAGLFCVNLREIPLYESAGNATYRHTHTAYRSTRFALRKTIW